MWVACLNTSTCTHTNTCIQNIKALVSWKTGGGSGRGKREKVEKQSKLDCLFPLSASDSSESATVALTLPTSPSHSLRLPCFRQKGGDKRWGWRERQAIEGGQFPLWWGMRENETSSARLHTWPLPPHSLFFLQCIFFTFFFSPKTSVCSCFKSHHQSILSSLLWFLNHSFVSSDTVPSHFSLLQFLASFWATFPICCKGQAGSWVKNH